MNWSTKPMTALNGYADWVLGPGSRYARYRRSRRGPGNSGLGMVIQGSATALPGGVFGKNLLPFPAPASHEEGNVSGTGPMLFSLFLDPEAGDVLANKGTDYPDVKAADLVISQPLPDDAYCDDCDDRILNERAFDGLPADAVIIGVIDHGIAFAHSSFRNSDGSSRVAHAWLQDAACHYQVPFGQTTSLAYGRDLSKWDRTARLGAGEPGIDTLLARNSRSGRLDEDGFYRDTGLIDHRRHVHKAAAVRMSHGTHVMDVAAGDEAAVSDNFNRPIIAVNLPACMVADTSGLGLEKYMIDAVIYILYRAKQLTSGGRALPVVLNFSSGLRAGPHDGTSVLEAQIDCLLKGYTSQTGQRAEMVMPAGNAYLLRGHARPELPACAPGGTPVPADLPWRIQPDDKTLTFAEVWVPDGDDSPDVGIALQPPGDASCSPILWTANQRQMMDLASGRESVCRIYSERGTLGHRFLIAVQPTAHGSREAAQTGNTAPLAPPGIWRIFLHNRGSQPLACDAWVHWDDSPLSFPRHGRQSYFDDAQYVRFESPSGRPRETELCESPVQRFRTLNAASSGELPVTVGAFRARDAHAASYSADGAHCNDDQRVDAAAIADESQVLTGVLGAGSRSGSRVALNGTSVAAPQVARLIADEMSGALKETSTPTARALVRQRAERRRHPDGMEDRLGKGRLDLPPHLQHAAQRLRRKPD